MPDLQLGQAGVQKSLIARMRSVLYLESNDQPSTTGSFLEHVKGAVA